MAAPFFAVAGARAGNVVNGEAPSARSAAELGR